MAKIKTYRIEARADERFGVAVKAGERTLQVDQPVMAGGADAGASPMEYLFASLAGCIATTARIIAKQQKIVLHGMDIQVSGSLDLDILYDRGTAGRPGLVGIDARVTVDAELSAAERERFLQELRRRCPIADTIAATTPMTMAAV